MVHNERFSAANFHQSLTEFHVFQRGAKNVPVADVSVGDQSLLSRFEIISGLQRNFLVCQRRIPVNGVSLPRINNIFRTQRIRKIVFGGCWQFLPSKGDGISLQESGTLSAVFVYDLRSWFHKIPIVVVGFWPKHEGTQDQRRHGNPYSGICGDFGGIGSFFGSGNGFFQNAGLDRHFRFLFLDGFPSDPQQLELNAPGDGQKEAEEPRSPIVNVVQKNLLLAVYREGRDAREGYAVLALLGGYFLCMFGVYWGTGLIIDGHLWRGYAVFVLAIAIGVAAAITGASGCFPWHWGHYGHCSQQPTEYRQMFQHDGENVSQISVLESGFDGSISDMTIMPRIVCLIDWGRRVQFVYQMAALALATSAGEFVRAYLVAHTLIAPIWRPPLYMLAFALALLIFASIGSWYKRNPLETSHPQLEINQELTLLFHLQVVALELRRDLQDFLKAQPVIERNTFDGPLAEREAKWRTACHQRDRKVRAGYELKFKDQAIKVFNLFVINDIRDDHLASLACNAASVEEIQDLIDTLWKVAGQVKS